MPDKTVALARCGVDTCDAVEKTLPKDNVLGSERAGAIGSHARAVGHEDRTADLTPLWRKHGRPGGGAQGVIPRWLRAPTRRAFTTAVLAALASFTLWPCHAGATPRHQAFLDAVDGGDVDRAATLLKEDPKILDEAEPPTKWTALHYAVARRDTSMVLWLLSKGAGTNRKGSEGETALHLAIRDPTDSVSSSPLRILSALLGAGADVAATDRYGATPLHWAAQYGDLEGARLLLQRKADVNAVAKRGKWIPLHGAASAGSVELVQLLIDSGSKVNARDGEGRTPLAVAKAQGRSEIVELLRSHGGME